MSSTLGIRSVRFGLLNLLYVLHLLLQLNLQSILPSVIFAAVFLDCLCIKKHISTVSAEVICDPEQGQYFSNYNYCLILLLRTEL